MIAGLFVRFLGFIYRIPLTDMLGDVGNGFYSAAFQIYIFFFMLSSAAVPSAMAKIIAENVQLGKMKLVKRTFKIALIFATLMSLVAGIFMFIFSRQMAILIGSEGATYALMVLAPTVVIVGIMGVFRGYFQGLQNMAPTAVSQVVEQIFNAVLSVVMAYLLVGKGIEYGVAGGTLGTLFGALSGLIYLIIIYFIKAKKIQVVEDETEEVLDDKTIFKNLVKTIVPIIIGSTVFTTAVLIDVLIIKRLMVSVGYSELEASTIYGQYTGKYIVFINFPAALITSLAVAVIPNISATYAAKDLNMVKIKLEKLLKLGNIFMVPMTVGLMVLAKPMLEMLYPNVSGGYEMFWYGMATLIFITIMKITTAVVQGVGKFWVPVYGSTVALVAKVIIIVVLVDKFGIYAAIISNYTTHIFTAIANLVYMRKKMDIKLDLVKLFLGPIIVGLIMGVVAYYSSNALYIYGPAASFFGAGTISTILYFGILYKFKIMTREDFKIR